MGYRLLKIVSLFFILVSGYALHAQTRFTATITPAVVGKDETAELTFTIENGTQVASIHPPSFNGFTVISGPNQESSMQILNGVVTQSVSLSYLLKPKATGDFTFAPASASVNGQTIESNSVHLKVVPNPTGNGIPGQPTMPAMPGFPGMDAPPAEEPSIYKDAILRKGENIREKINKNLFIKAEADKTSCYIGEPVVVTYKLYTRLKVENERVKTPAFNGFSMIDLTPGNASGTGTINGRSYDTYILMRVQLYPLQDGTLDVGTLETDNKVHFIREAYLQEHGNDAGNSFFLPADALDEEQVSLKNQPLSIQVKPLPTSNRPASFKGAVGSFDISASLDKDSFSTDDAGKLTLTISGSGNLLLVTAPDISWPAGIESFSPNVNDQLDKTQVPVSGNKQITYTFTAGKSGTYTIAPVKFSFFDPKANAYETIATQPLHFTVTQGSGKNSLSSNDRAHTHSLHPWQLTAELSALMALIGLFWWFNKRKRGAPSGTSNVAIQTAETLPEETRIANYLEGSEVQLLRQDFRAFYEMLNKEVRQFLSAYFHILPEEINKKRIAEELDKKGIPVNIGLKVQRLLDDIEWQLYSPLHDHSTLEQSFSHAKEMIYALELLN